MNSPAMDEADILLQRIFEAGLRQKIASSFEWDLTFPSRKHEQETPAEELQKLSVGHLSSIFMLAGSFLLAAILSFLGESVRGKHQPESHLAQRRKCCYQKIDSPLLQKY